MPIIRKKLDPNDVYPSDLRYNGTTDAVQSLVNGTWVDSPQRDPRKQTLYPPRVTSTPRCDAAQSVVDALKGQIDQTITAIQNGGNATTLAGIILALFYFGPFGVFISIAIAIANAMLGAGATALQAALTNEVYHKLVCYLDCQMDANGVITEEGLNTVKSQMSTDPGGLAATVLNAMLSLAGFGGVNNLAALGASTGNCVDCPCEGWCFDWDLTIADGGGVPYPGLEGVWTSGVGWVDPRPSTMIIDFSRNVSGGAVLTQIDLGYNSPDACITSIQVLIGGTYVYNNPNIAGAAGEHIRSDVVSLSGDMTIRFAGYDGVGFAFNRIRLHGTGTNPFGTNNC